MPFRVFLRRSKERGSQCSVVKSFEKRHLDLFLIKQLQVSKGLTVAVNQTVSFLQARSNIYLCYFHQHLNHKGTVFFFPYNPWHHGLLSSTPQSPSFTPYTQPSWVLLSPRNKLSLCFKFRATGEKQFTEQLTQIILSHAFDNVGSLSLPLTNCRSKRQKGQYFFFRKLPLVYFKIMSLFHQNPIYPRNQDWFWFSSIYASKVTLLITLLVTTKFFHCTATCWTAFRGKLIDRKFAQSTYI